MTCLQLLFSFPSNAHVVVMYISVFCSLQFFAASSFSDESISPCTKLICLVGLANLSNIALAVTFVEQMMWTWHVSSESSTRDRAYSATTSMSSFFFSITSNEK